MIWRLNLKDFLKHFMRRGIERIPELKEKDLRGRHEAQQLNDWLAIDQQPDQPQIVEIELAPDLRVKIRANSGKDETLPE
jgi:hypothetical protein